MKLSGRITVEPLDDDRLTSIERRVVAGAAEATARGRGFAARRRRGGRMLAAIAVVMAGFVGWALRGAPASAPMEAAPMSVESASSRTVVDIGDAQIASEPATAFVVTRSAGGVLVAMTRGKVELEVGKRGDRPPLIVRAGDTDVVVVGTHFTVDYGDGRGGASVSVTEGVVRVVHQQQEIRVAAGQRWASGGVVAAADRDAAPPAPAPSSAIASGAAVETRANAAGAPRVAVDDRRDRRGAPATAAAASPARSATGRMIVPVRPPASAAQRQGMTRRADPQLDLRTAIRTQPVEPALDLGEPNPAVAVARYYDIAAHRSGEEASQAFYSIAVVRYEKLERNADALETLDAYVRRFPGGKEYRAVLWLRVRILCLDKIDDRCRAAAHTYLHEAPDGPAAHIAELLTMAE